MGKAGEDAAKALGDGLGRIGDHTKTAQDALRGLNDAQTTAALSAEKLALAQMRYTTAAVNTHSTAIQLAQAHYAVSAAQAAHERAAESLTDAQNRLNATHQGAVGYLAAHSASLGEWALAAGSAASAAAGLVFSLSKVGDTFEDINRGLELTNSSAGAGMEELKSHADALVASVDTATNQIGSDMGVMASRLQLEPGAALDQLTEHVGMLRDRFGQLDTPALTSGFREFHVEAAQTNDALASLTQTAIGAGVNVGAVVTQLAAGGTTLAEAGLNYQQAAYLIAQADKDIGDGGAQKAITGIEMGMKDAVKHGMDFQTYIKDVMYSLSEFQRKGDTKNFDALAEQAFGTRKWAEVQAIFKDYNESLRATNQQLAASPGYLDESGRKTRNLDNVFHELRNHIEAALQPPAENAVDVVGDKAKELMDWIDDHRDDIRNLFTTGLDAAKDLLEAVTTVASWLAKYPGLIEVVAGAFAAWKTIEGVAALVTSLQTIDGLLKGLPASAALAGSGISVGLAPAIAAVGELLALANLHGSAASPNIGPGSDDRQKRLEAGKAYADAHGGQVPPGYMQWLDKGGTPPAGITMPGAAPGTPFFDAQGRPLDAQGKPIGPPAPKPGDPGYYVPGSKSYAPGALGGPPPGGTGGPGERGRDTPTTPGGAPGGAPDLIFPDDPNKPKKGPRLPQAPEVPYGAGYGAPPEIGETERHYAARQQLLEQRHQLAEDQARLDQLEKDSNATEADIQKVRNKILTDRGNIIKAEGDLNHIEEDSLQRHGDALAEMGAKIDNDFGISKGLPGIAENLTKFLANLAFSPVYGALKGVDAAYGGPTHGAGGVIGMLALGAGMGNTGGPARGGWDGMNFGGPPMPGLGGASSAQAGLGNRAVGAGLGALLGPAGPVVSATGGPPAMATPGAGYQAPAQSTSGIPIPAPGSGAESWRNTVASVVDRYGPAMGVTPATRQAWIDRIVSQIGTESRGNPNASNPHDSDGRGGTQDVEGLLQYLPSSYAASGGRLTGLPYMDPIGQIAGALFAPRDANGFPIGIGTGHGWGPNTATPINPSLLPHAVQNDPNQPGYNGPPIPGVTMPALAASTPGMPVLGSPSPFDRNNLGGPGVPSLGLPGMADGGATPPSSLPQGAVPIIAHQNEHVLTSDDVNAMGGQGAVYAMREQLHAGEGQPGGGPQAPRAGAPAPPVQAHPGGPQPGPSLIGGIAPSAGYGSGFQVTGGGLVGIAESLPSTAVSAAISAAESAGAAGALYGGAIEDLLPSYFDGGPPGETPGGGSPGGASPGGGAGAAGSLTTAAINIGMGELNAGISSLGQAAGAAVGGLQQTFGPQQFAQSQQAQTGWITKLIGGIMGAQPQLPNTAGAKGTPPGLTPEQAASQHMAAGGGGTNVSYGDGTNNGVHIENFHAAGSDEQAGYDLHHGWQSAQGDFNSITGTRGF